jgi:hypothetical protein
VKTARLGAAALLVVVGLIVGIAALAGGGSGSSSEGGGSEAVSLSASELLAKAGSLSGPAYWIGPRAGTSSYELTDTPDGRIYIRYLTGGTAAGDPRPDFLTVGSYPVAEAAKALEGVANSGEGQTLSHRQGYEVLSSSGATNAYVVFDEQPDIQVEVFSPQAGEAAQLATSGALRPLR